MAEQGLSTDSSVSIHDLPQVDREVEIIEASHAGFDDDTIEPTALQGGIFGGGFYCILGAF